MPEGSGRTNRPGNNAGVNHSGRTGSKGNRESVRLTFPESVHQNRSNTGRSARPGNDAPMGMPANPTHGVGKASVPSGGVPGRTVGKFQQVGVKY